MVLLVGISKFPNPKIQLSPKSWSSPTFSLSRGCRFVENSAKMKKYKATELLDQLQSDVRQMLVTANYLRSEDPHYLMEQPAPGKWSVIQVLEHLNSYNRYYLPAIKNSLMQDKPASGYFRPGWLGDYFTKLMQPKEGMVKNKMRSPKDHRPAPFLDAMPVLNTFIEDQHQLLNLLEDAKQKDIGRLRTPVSIFKLIRLKTGDTFRFLIAHEQRHFVQIASALEAVKRSPSFLPSAG
jgi:hypothetical protein